MTRSWSAWRGPSGACTIRAHAIAAVLEEPLDTVSERVGLLLVNLGTPDAPRPREVRRYLREFLSDPRVLDLPAWRRWRPDSSTIRGRCRRSSHLPAATTTS